MKRRNVVFLGGPLLEVATRMDVVDNTSKQVLVGTVVTDFQGCGGYHPVVFLERQAIEVLVFRQYATQQGQTKLTVTVDGWLRSAPLTCPPSSPIASRSTWPRACAGRRLSACRRSSAAR